MRIVTAVCAAASVFLAGLIGCGPADARPPDVVGKTYEKAASELSAAGLKPIVTATVGSRLPRDKCIVTSVSDRKMLRPAVGEAFMEFGWGEIMLSLNCNGGHATAGTPGNSLGSPEGRRAADYEAEVQWRKENPQWCVDAMREHPEWGEMDGCTYK